MVRVVGVNHMVIKVSDYKKSKAVNAKLECPLFGPSWNVPFWRSGGHTVPVQGCMSQRWVSGPP